MTIPIPLTPRGKRLIHAALAVAKRNNHSYLAAEHILVALFEKEQQDGVVAELCKRRRWKQKDMNELLTSLYK